MSDRKSPPLDHPAFDVPDIAGMKPWECTYVKDGSKYGITLYGTTEEQVLNDNCAELAGLEVLGVQSSIIPFSDDEAWRMIREYESKKKGTDL